MVKGELRRACHSFLFTCIASVYVKQKLHGRKDTSIIRGREFYICFAKSDRASRLKISKYREDLKTVWT
jgi:hypothetical protein